MISDLKKMFEFIKTDDMRSRSIINDHKFELLVSRFLIRHNMIILYVQKNYEHDNVCLVKCFYTLCGL